MMARVAAAADFDVLVATPDVDTAAQMDDLGIPVRMLDSQVKDWALPIDPWTATVLLFHQREWEDRLLLTAVEGPGFYVGALGSVRTQRERLDRLATQGVAPPLLRRIRGPIGLITQARDPATLALSVLAEISATRKAIEHGSALAEVGTA